MKPPGHRICILLDHDDESVRNAALETVAFGQALAADMGASLELLLLCADPKQFEARLSTVSADKVDFLTAPELEHYDPDAYCTAAAPFLEESRPDYLLLAHTYQNIDFAPKLAARLGTGLATDCIDYRVEEEGVVLVRQMFRNKLNADVIVRSRPPVIATIQAGSASLDQVQSGAPMLSVQTASLGGFSRRRRALETIEAASGRVDLDKAEIVVGVGRGIKKAENLKLIEDLADALGAEIGASRPVVDNEWLERERQIGSSGQNIAPRLYIACGISGAIQHVVGMKNSSCIVAINSDPNAPIFNLSHYGVVGDLFEVVPQLIQALRELD